MGTNGGVDATSRSDEKEGKEGYRTGTRLGIRLVPSH